MSDKSTIPRSQFLRILPLDDVKLSFYLSIVAGLFSNYIKDTFAPLTSESWLFHFKRVFKEEFIIPSSVEEELNGEESVFYTGLGLNEDFEKNRSKRKEKLELLLLKFKPWEKHNFSNANTNDRESGSIYETIEMYQRNDYDYQSELLDLDVSGLTPAQVQFIFENSEKHDFCVNPILHGLLAIRYYMGGIILIPPY